MPSLPTFCNLEFSPWSHTSLYKLLFHLQEKISPFSPPTTVFRLFLPIYHVKWTHLKWPTVYKCQKQVHEKILTKNELQYLGKLFHRYPLRSVGYFLHYHWLSSTDSPLGPRDCNFPAKQEVKIDELIRIPWSSRLMQSKRMFIPIICSRQEIASIRYLYPGPTCLQKCKAFNTTCRSSKWWSLISCLSTYLTDLHYIPSTTTDNESNMIISNANSYRVTSFLLENNIRNLVSQSIKR